MLALKPFTELGLNEAAAHVGAAIKDDFLLLALQYGSLGLLKTGPPAPAGVQSEVLLLLLYLELFT